MCVFTCVYMGACVCLCIGRIEEEKASVFCVRSKEVNVMSHSEQNTQTRPKGSTKDVCMCVRKKGRKEKWHQYFV